MKKWILFVLISFSLSLSAQDFSLEPNPSYVEGIATNQPLIAFADIINHTDSSQVVIWKRLTEDLPAGWTSNICTPLGCFLPEIPEGELSMLPLESLNIDVQFETNGIGGSGRVEVKIYFDTDSTNFIVGVYEADATAVSTTEGPEKLIPVLFPNPCARYCFISNGEAVTSYEIFTVLGDKLTTGVYEGTKINLQDLESGLYFVRLFDENRRLLTVEILEKMH